MPNKIPMTKFSKISLLLLLFFGFVRNVFACGGGSGIEEYGFIFGIPTIIAAVFIYFGVKKNDGWKKLVIVAIVLVLLVLYYFIAYNAMAGLLCGASEF